MTTEIGEVEEEFASLFEGRLDAFGTDTGGCDWVLTDHGYPLPSFGYTFYEERIRRHLCGQGPMGVYPIVHAPLGPVVKWGCVDFDEGDEVSWVHANNLHLVLNEFKVTGWIERSRSKGYHVWVFLSDWTPTAVVRRALLAACQLVDAPTKEINPKQEALPVGSIGNYVRLPYPSANVATEPPSRQVMVAPGTGDTIPLVPFLAAAPHVRTTLPYLEPLAELYQEPPRFVPTETPPSTLEGDVRTRLSGLAYTIWQNGPLENADRSGTLYKLARQIRQDGHHTFAEAVDLMWDADQRWGKFHERPRGRDDLQKLVERAWL